MLLDAAILVVSPDARERMLRHWAKHKLPFQGMADPDHVVSGLFGQKSSWWRLGRMPAVVIADKSGVIRYRHYATAMWDLPDTKELLALLERLDREWKSR